MFIAEDISLWAGRKAILSDVSAELAPGELSVIIGPNGAGKSTLLKCLSGELQPSSGRVRVFGRDVRGAAPEWMAARRAVLPQAAALSFPFTVYEIVSLGLSAGVSGVSREQERELPLLALKAVDMEGYGERLVQNLSGGEQQRVHLARVLCQIWTPVLDGSPRFLFLDEPTASLDIHHQMMVLDLARSYARQGGGVLAIVHDLNLAALYADQIIVMNKGAVAARGNAHETITNAVLEEVFKLPGRVGEIPRGNAPFVLPQAFASALSG